MRVWTVHLPPGASSLARSSNTPTRVARPPILVREGFAWGAFLFALPWLLWHRLWLEAAGYLGLVLVLAFLVPQSAALPVALALQFLLGAHARDLRRAALARRGWRMAHVVTEADEDLALARLLQARPDLTPMMAGLP